jgi:PAS domain-containing protein
MLGDPDGIPLREFLAGLDVPTFLVDDDGRVRAANPGTLGMVGKTEDQVTGQLGGKVFSCVNADLPGGCGMTELCSACTVRNTVTETYETGQSQVRIPSTLRVESEEGEIELAFFLTTEKVGGRVLVQIEAEP